ncbi:NAD(P)-dependent oxidoreductase [Subtercola boreus]|uniref:NmrA family transcriptional regulator n=1 Tax=Subtercola boreus TaxID=120213 RepID=A0A3E0W6J2_9MICO|nr:NAD(P)-binding oxidoreductase [Subtercola boreus]RFA18102.1 NmrA family transcriptional regulator [Subtercola boreus]RFA18484.1 NmrA family transcriptional regulator [Subtercola boreus]RFA25012.1 NmrA family transcriptional regulator [Subtercola boreus]
MTSQTFLVFGATGQTGQHFTSLALREGHTVRALARNPSKFGYEHPALEVHTGTVTDIPDPDLDELVRGVDYVVSMLGDVEAQKTRKVNTEFVRRLVPAMRRQGVKRFLYQAGGLSKAPGQPLPPALWAVRKTLARSYNGQHEDNEAVMQYLTDEASDIEWMVHRAGIGSNGPSKGVLQRSSRAISIATFIDCAAYTYRTVMDPSAVHTCDPSAYRKP